MATRNLSKIMSVAEKKTAEAGLKTVLKDTAAGVKASEVLLAAANANLAKAKKAADALVKEATKVHDKALKDGGKLIAIAQKEVDAASKKHTKVFDAAGKGTDKVTAQLAALAAVPVEAAKRGPKPKVPATV